MKRTIALGAAWTASAAAAVGLGFLAVSLVDASASPGTTDAAATTAAATGTTAATASALPAATSADHATVGGSVFASCLGGVPSLAGAPAPGWWIDDSSAPGQIEFKSATQKLEVHVSCVDGSPQFSEEGPRGEDSGRGGGSRSSSSTAVTAPAGPTTDDSTGRVGGGHGADDPPGDDSSGRNGGGHGADG